MKGGKKEKVMGNRMGVKEKEKERTGVVCGRINSRRRMENRGVVVVSTSTKGG